MERNRRTHILVDDALAEASTLLGSAGFNPVLLKGQAYARYYPRPLLRQCGDIDLYVGSADFVKACEAAVAAGWYSDETIESAEKHFVCILSDVFVELHRYLLSLPSRSADMRFRSWCDDELTAGGRSHIVNGVSLSLPSPIFDVVYVFLHLYCHFLTSGIGLR